MSNIRAVGRAPLTNPLAPPQPASPSPTRTPGWTSPPRSGRRRRWARAPAGPPAPRPAPAPAGPAVFGYEKPPSRIGRRDAGPAARGSDYRDSIRQRQGLALRTDPAGPVGPEGPRPGPGRDRKGLLPGAPQVGRQRRRGPYAVTGAHHQELPVGGHEEVGGRGRFEPRHRVGPDRRIGPQRGRRQQDRQGDESERSGQAQQLPPVHPRPARAGRPRPGRPGQFFEMVRPQARRRGGRGSEQGLERDPERDQGGEPQQGGEVDGHSGRRRRPGRKKSNRLAAMARPTATIATGPIHTHSCGPDLGGSSRISSP